MTVTRSEFARMAGVSPAAVTKLCNSVLKSACIGKRIDTSKPAAQDYLKERDNPGSTGVVSKRGRSRTGGKENGTGTGQNGQDGQNGQNGQNGRTPRGRQAANIKQKQAAPVDPDMFDGMEYIAEDIKEFADWSLRDLVKRFGTDTRFKDWLAATKMLEEIEAKRLANETTRGQLVERELVVEKFIDPVNATHVKLLTSGSQTIAKKIIDMVKSGSDVLDVQREVRDQLESYIKPMKTKMKRDLRGNGQTERTEQTE